MVMVRLLFCILALVFYLNGLHAQIKIIENEYLSLKVEKDNISLNSKNVLDTRVLNMMRESLMIDETRFDHVNDEEWGKGQQLVVNFEDGYQISFRLYAQNPFLHIYTTIRNNTQRDIQISGTEILSVDMAIGDMKKQLTTLGSGGYAPVRNAMGSFTYSLLAEPESRHSILLAWLTQKQGIGMITPSLGGASPKYRVTAKLEFGNYLVKAGQERGTDVLMIGLFDDGREGLELYGEHLAKAYRITLPKRPEVYCTWYHRKLTGSGASTEEMLLENARFARKELAPFGLNTFQIDDHWQNEILCDKITEEAGKKRERSGPLKTFWESNSNFPKGMDYITKELDKNGFTSGIWFIPFAGDMHNACFPKDIFATHRWSGMPYETKKWSGTCIDATSPAGEDFLRKRFKRIYDWGYRYLKIDGLHTGAPSENIYINRAYRGGELYGKACIYDPNKTFTECFRRGLSILREEAPDAFLLGCSTTQNMSSFAAAFGLVDGMRVGPDNDKASLGDWECVTRGADYAGNLYFLNNRVWYNDPDPYYVRETNPLHKARWMVSWQSIAGAMSTTSMQYEKLSAERLDLIKRGLPTHTLNARPIDILESEKPRIWMVGNERMKVIGLFNWFEKEESKIDYPMGRMGLDASKKYELFDFWKNKYEGTVSGKLVHVLAPASCAVLAVRETKSYPQVISTSRHITQGLIDIEKESWDTSKKTLSGTSKVVKGDLYELRIIVPQEYKAQRAECNGERMNMKQEGDKLLRVYVVPDKSGKVNWSIEF